MAFTCSPESARLNRWRVAADKPCWTEGPRRRLYGEQKNGIYNGDEGWKKGSRVESGEEGLSTASSGLAWQHRTIGRRVRRAAKSDSPTAIRTPLSARVLPRRVRSEGWCSSVSVILLSLV